jgi:hypothetical protein
VGDEKRAQKRERKAQPRHGVSGYNEGKRGVIIEHTQNEFLTNVDAKAVAGKLKHKGIPPPYIFILNALQCAEIEGYYPDQRIDVARSIKYGCRNPSRNMLRYESIANGIVKEKHKDKQ